MAKRRVGLNADIERGKRLGEELDRLLPEAGRSERAKRFGVAETTLANWEAGASIRNDALAKLVGMGADVLYILTGSQRPPSEPLQTQLAVDGLPVVGSAAADDSGFERTEFFQEITETKELPGGLKLVRVQGDSMSPVVIDGQWVMIDAESERPPHGGIVVAQIRERDGRLLDGYEYYCKRAFVEGDRITFLSVNVNIGSPPFIASLRNCRLWPVIGVYFGGQGKAPV